MGKSPNLLGVQPQDQQQEMVGGSGLLSGEFLAKLLQPQGQQTPKLKVDAYAPTSIIITHCITPPYVSCMYCMYLHTYTLASERGVVVVE